jgi:hypothetical protein
MAFKLSFLFESLGDDDGWKKKFLLAELVENGTEKVLDSRTTTTTTGMAAICSQPLY